MIKKVIFLFFNIILLGILFGCTICNANEMPQVGDFVVKGLDFNVTEAFVESPHFDSCQSKCFLLESTSEQESSDSSYLKLPLVFDTLVFYIRFSNPIKRSKLESHGLLERNFTPAQHVSRNILFHSLQIHF